MFEELTGLLNDSTGSVLITSFDIDSNFLLEHFLSIALKNGQSIVYLSVLTPFSHLKHIQTKMGNHLKTSEISSASPLMFIPLFTSLSERFFQGQSMMTVDELCQYIEQQAVASSPQMIIVEDLQILRHLLKYTDKDILFFQRRIRQIYPRAQIISQLSIGDDENDEETFSTTLINLLKRLHEHHLFVRNLPTGATKDITGQVIYSSFVISSTHQFIFFLFLS